MSGEVWYAAFAYHSEKEWAGLLRGELRDVAEAAHHLGCDFWVTREWQRGPHLRLGIRGGDTDRARALIDDQLAAILRDRPATRTVELSEVRDEAERFARRSGVTLRSDWLANNTITWTGPLPVEGVQDLPGVLEEFHFTASLPALHMLDDVGGQQQVLRLCELMVATAQRYGRNGLLAASTSFRSHAEAYLALEAPPGTRAVWDAEAARSAPALREHLFAIARGVIVPAHVREWLTVLDPVIDTAKELYRSGHLKLPTTESGFDAGLTERSVFHREIADTEGWRALSTSEWFVLYRLALSLLYLQFSRLGVQPAARFRLCHLVASAVQGATSSPTIKENS